MLKNLILIPFLLILIASFASAQDKRQEYLSISWQQVATQMPNEWYGSDEARLVIENLLISQKELGGWEKNKPYHHVFSDSLKVLYSRNKRAKGGTFDNGSTIMELRFLAKVYPFKKDQRVKEAFERGLNYIIMAQYENGGWPQYFPVKDASAEILLDKTEPYSMHITYNDNAMVNIMEFLKEIYSDKSGEFIALKVSDQNKERAHKAFNKGIQCVLKTQIIVGKEPTVWCAQHDEKTLSPAKARAYELESFSGAESVGITEMLMNIENPSERIITSVKSALKWFEKNKIEGIRIDNEIDKEGRKNRIVVQDKNAPPLWARFYDLKTGKPYFCDRDGIKKATMAEIGYERRNGYRWYTDAPAVLFGKYAEWRKKWNVN